MLKQYICEEGAHPSPKAWSMRTRASQGLEMTRGLRALDALIQDMGSVLSTHVRRLTTTCRSSSKEPCALGSPRGAMHLVDRISHRHIHTTEKNKNK